jgi:hypothetical protein
LRSRGYVLASSGDKEAVLRGLPILLVVALSAAWPGGAAAEPVSFPHGTIDQRYTTTQPNAPSGFEFDATYHAAGDPSAYPPYMRKMIAYNPDGKRFDTSVPDRCTASDVELALRGAEACPPGSRLGEGTTKTAFMGGFPPQTVALDFFNNTNEQIILARSPILTTIARGRIHPDGSTEFASPTCYPSVPTAGCPVDNVLQLESHVDVPAYTRTVDGVVRSYLTTPPECPPRGFWKTPIRLWWADGSVDTVVTRQPCT